MSKAAPRKKKRKASPPKAPPKVEPRPIGRPPLLTPEVQERICRTLRSIGTVEDAARKAGVDDKTIYYWMAKGRQEQEGPFFEFFEAVKDARAERRLRMERQLRKHGRTTWQALARFMEMTEPTRYAPRVVVHVTRELTDAVERLKEAFADDAVGLERALSALAEGDSWGGAGEAETAEDAALPRGGEALQPPQAEPEAGGIPQSRLP